MVAGIRQYVARFHGMLPPLELILWLGCLVGMAFIDPSQPKAFSLCLIHNLGWSCPGCGLGHSIAWLFRGDIVASFLTHPLGLPAVILLGWRVITLTRQWIKGYKSALTNI